MKILLKDLPNHPELIGKKINIRRQGGKFHYDYQDIPMIRIFTGARINKKDNSVRWEWVPEYSQELSNHDCGYSGVGLDGVHAGSYLDIDNKSTRPAGES